MILVKKIALILFISGGLVSCSLVSEVKDLGGTLAPITPVVVVDPSGISIKDGPKAVDITAVTVENTNFTFTPTQVGDEVKLIPNQNISLTVGVLYRILVSTANAQSTFTIQAEFPTGAIMAFNSATCPTGWTSFAPAKGRVLVGAGSGNVDADMTPLSTRTLGDVGGREFTTGAPAYSGAGNEPTPSPLSVPAKVPGGMNGLSAYTTNAPDTTVGGDKHDSNMMPYAVILYCQKN